MAASVPVQVQKVTTTDQHTVPYSTLHCGPQYLFSRSTPCDLINHRLDEFCDPLLAWNRVYRTEKRIQRLTKTQSKDDYASL